MSDQKHLENIQEKAHKARVGDSPVYSFMSKNPVSIAEGTKIYMAIQALATHKVGSAPVVNAKGQIIGVISEHDLLIQTATKDVIDQIDFKKDPVTVKPDAALKDVLVFLYKMKIRRLPVVGPDQSVVGVVTRMDVLLKLIGKDKP